MESRHHRQRKVFALLIALALYSVAEDARAQDATVFVTHRLTSQGPTRETTYRLAGEDTARRHAGLPGMLEVPAGSRACVVVENANPVLYSYSLSAKAIKVTAPDSMVASMKLLMGLAQAASPALAKMGTTAMIGALPSAAPDTSYAAAVAAVYRPYLTLADLRAISDSATNLPAIARQVSAVFADSVKKYNNVADATYDSLKVKTAVQTRMLRAQQLEAFQKASGIATEFAMALGRYHDPICTTALTGRSRVVLAVASQAGTKDAARATGDSLIAFTAEAETDQDFEFGAGMVVNALTSHGKNLAVENGVVTEKTADAVLFRPIFFGHYRNWGARWLYATVGTAVSGKSISDVFLGATSRFGARSGVGIALGFGLALSEQVVDLKQGRIGDALPKDVSNLSDITTKQLKPGLGIALSLTGF